MVGDVGAACRARRGLPAEVRRRLPSSRLRGLSPSRQRTAAQPLSTPIGHHRADPVSPRITTVGRHLARTSPLPDRATCPLLGARWPSSSSFQEKPPRFLSHSRIAWLAHVGGSGLRRRPLPLGREVWKLPEEAFAAADGGSQRRRRRRWGRRLLVR